MQESDVSEVAQIEELCGLSRWGASAYQREIAKNPRSIMLVARLHEGNHTGPRVLGFLCSQVVADEWHIYNVASHPEYRRRSISWRLMREGAARARDMGATVGFLEVRASNQSALALYEKLGFVPVDRRKAYYRQPVEDCIVMRCHLGTLNAE
jgi:ribosomal-protein-alanine N-acetyltransferase